MAEYPILFKPEMIRAVLRDIDPKTQTRRLGERWKKVKPGDLLWVKEATHQHYQGGPGLGGRPCYRADGTCSARLPWKSPMFMPRAFARIILEVLDNRRQHLQEITEEDAKAEGIVQNHTHPVRPGRDGRDGFRSLWDSINGKRAPWASNPEVSAITFRRVP